MLKMAVGRCYPLAAAQLNSREIAVLGCDDHRRLRPDLVPTEDGQPNSLAVLVRSRSITLWKRICGLGQVGLHTSGNPREGRGLLKACKVRWETSLQPRKLLSSSG